MARLPVVKTYKLCIDGKFPRSESGRVASGCLLPEVHRVGAESHWVVLDDRHAESEELQSRR
jgi:hypothetical protein